MTESRTPREAAADWYIFLREDTQDEDLRARFDLWLNEDPAHVAAWADMNATSTLIGAVPLASGRHVAARRDGSVSRPPTRRHVRRLPLVAAALAAACVGLICCESDLLIRLRADHMAPVGATRDIRLADGSSVTLGPLSAIRYPLSAIRYPLSAIAVDMSPTQRSVRLLRGDALFTVMHDAARPFHVMAADVTATDIGTVFDVRLDDDATIVAVREGAVHVSAPGGVERDLQAGGWLSVSDGHAREGTVVPEAVGAWRDGILIANDETISNVIAALRPWTSARIVLASRSLGARRVTGTYSLHQPETSLRLAVGPYSGQVKSLPPWLDIVTER